MFIALGHFPHLKFLKPFALITCLEDNVQDENWQMYKFENLQTYRFEGYFSFLRVNIKL